MIEGTTVGDASILAESESDGSGGLEESGTQEKVGADLRQSTA
jgi:hypothetical protein